MFFPGIRSSQVFTYILWYEKLRSRLWKHLEHLSKSEKGWRNLTPSSVPKALRDPGIFMCANSRPDLCSEIRQIQKRVKWKTLNTFLIFNDKKKVTVSFLFFSNLMCNFCVLCLPSLTSFSWSVLWFNHVLLTLSL